jgi:hypothetical protein
VLILADPMLKHRIAEGHARSGPRRRRAGRRVRWIGLSRPSPVALKTLPGRPAGGCGPSRAATAATAFTPSCIEVHAKEVRIIGSKSVLLRALVIV